MRDTRTCFVSWWTRSGIDRPSINALGQRHDDPLWSSDVCHAPYVLVLADASNHAVAVRGQPVDGGLQIVNLEGHVPQSELVGHGGRRPGIVVGPHEAGQFQPGTSVRRP